MSPHDLNRTHQPEPHGPPFTMPARLFAASDLQPRSPLHATVFFHQPVKPMEIQRPQSVRGGTGACTAPGGDDGRKEKERHQHTAGQEPPEHRRNAELPRKERNSRADCNYYRIASAPPTK